MRTKINRKGQIPSTITWFVAFTIIFFIMIIYVGAASFVGFQKKSNSNSNELNIISGDLTSIDSFESLLNSRMEYEGEEISFRDAGIILSLDFPLETDLDLLEVLQEKAEEELGNDCSYFALKVFGDNVFFVNSLKFQKFQNYNPFIYPVSILNEEGENVEIKFLFGEGDGRC